MKPKSYALHAHSTETHGMEFGRFYVVEVSMNPSNPVFRAVAMHARGSHVTIAGNVEGDSMPVRLDQIAFFRVVEEIEAMRAPSSRFMPPAALPATS